MGKRLTPEQAEVEIKVKEAYRLSVDAANNIYRVLKEPELQEHDDIVTWWIIPDIHTILDAEHRKRCINQAETEAEKEQVQLQQELILKEAGGETVKHASDYIIEAYLKPDIKRVKAEKIKKKIDSGKSPRKLIRRWCDNLQVDISLRKETELDKWFLSEIACGQQSTASAVNPEQKKYTKNNTVKEVANLFFDKHVGGDDSTFAVLKVGKGKGTHQEEFPELWELFKKEHPEWIKDKDKPKSKGMGGRDSFYTHLNNWRELQKEPTEN